MALPVATRLVVQALREEAESVHLEYAVAEGGMESTILYSVQRALSGVADRLEASGSSVHPRTPPSDPDAPAISEGGHDPHRPDKSHPGPEVVRTDPDAVHATLVELKRHLRSPMRNRSPLSPREMQLLDDAIKLSSPD